MIHRRLLTAALLLLMANLPLGASSPTSALAAPRDLDQFVFLPLVSKPPSCGLSAEEARLAELMRTDPGQERPSLTCDPILAQVARARAQDMAARGYFDHVNPDGYGPNCLVTMAGYPLPSFYSPCPDGNNIESIAGGYATPESAWQGWMSSTPHRTHLLGLEPFFAEQIEYGIGHAFDPNSPYGHYWVVITARRP